MLCRAWSVPAGSRLGRELLPIDTSIGTRERHLSELASSPNGQGYAVIGKRVPRPDAPDKPEARRRTWPTFVAAVCCTGRCCAAPILTHASAELMPRPPSPCPALSHDTLSTTRPKTSRLSISVCASHASAS